MVRFAYVLACAVATVGCAPAPAEVGRAPRAPATELAAPFAYQTTSGETFASSTTRGRPVVLAFITTFDIASQVQARVIDDATRHHAARPHVLALVLELRDHAVLADAFRDSMGLSYPVSVLGVQGEYDGPFGNIDRVPTVVVLDVDGLVEWRKAGLSSPREIHDALAAAMGRGSARAPRKEFQ